MSESMNGLMVVAIMRDEARGQASPLKIWTELV